jgi:hypothetical protein
MATSSLFPLEANSQIGVLKHSGSILSLLDQRWGEFASLSLALLLSLLVLVTAIQFRRSFVARLIPGIPVVGGSDAAAMHSTSQKFFVEAKSILLDGYKQVSLP